MKANVGARFGVSVLRRRVEADQIARHQLEIFQAQCRRSRRHSFAPGCLSMLIVCVRSAVDRVMKADIVQAESSAAFTPTVTSSIGLAR